MITNFLPYIFGVPTFLFGVYLVLISFRIYKPKFNDDKKREQFENRIAKYNILLKIISILLLLSGGYDLLWHNIDRYRVTDQPEYRGWTDADKTKLKTLMLSDVTSRGVSDTLIANDYAQCASENIIEAMTPKEYLENSLKPDSVKQKIFLPLIKGCLDYVKQKLDSLGLRKVTASL